MGFRDTKREFGRILGGCLDALEEVEAANSSPRRGKTSLGARILNMAVYPLLSYPRGNSLDGNHIEAEF